MRTQFLFFTREYATWANKTRPSKGRKVHKFHVHVTHRPHFSGLIAAHRNSFGNWANFLMFPGIPGFNKNPLWKKGNSVILNETQTLNLIARPLSFIRCPCLFLQLAHQDERPHYTTSPPSTYTRHHASWKCPKDEGFSTFGVKE